MKHTRRFIPNGWDGLEIRLVLNAAAPRLAAQITALNSTTVATGPQTRLALARIDTAFKNFSETYFQTLNTYLTPPNNTATTQFAAAVTQEVNVLAQNVIQVILPVTGSTNRQPHGQPPIQNLVNRRILAINTSSLQGALASAQPPSGSTKANDQLYVVTAQNAISAANAAVDNGVRILRLGAFNGSNSASHH